MNKVSAVWQGGRSKTKQGSGQPKSRSRRGLSNLAPAQWVVDKVSPKMEKNGRGNCNLDPTLPLDLVYYLRLLMRKQPLLRSDWETMDFFQELSVRFISNLKRHSLMDLPTDHRAALVLRMAQQVGYDHLRQIQRKKRDCRRVKVQETEQVIQPGADPGRHLVEQETLARVRSIVSNREWALLEMHSQGTSWDEIAQTLGGTASSQRMRHIRLTRRLSLLNL